MDGVCVHHGCVTGDVSCIPGASGVSACKEFTMFEMDQVPLFSG